MQDKSAGIGQTNDNSRERGDMPAYAQSWAPWTCSGRLASQEENKATTAS